MKNRKKRRSIIRSFICVINQKAMKYNLMRFSLPVPLIAQISSDIIWKETTNKLEFEQHVVSHPTVLYSLIV